MEIRRHLLLGLSALVMLSACSRGQDDAPTSDATLSVALGTDLTAQEVSLTKQAGLSVTADEFSFHIENAPKPGADPDTLASWPRFSEVPAVLRYTPGAYKLVATYGADTPLPVFDIPTYRAETKITMAKGEHQDISMTATLATTKMSVAFDPSFAEYYADYSVDIRTVGDNFLSFTKEEQRAGYFEPGTIRMRFNLRTHDGKDFTYSPPAVVDTPTKAKEYYRLTLKVLSNNGKFGMTVTTDPTTNDKDVAIEIPQYMLPKAPPLLTPSGFESGVPIVTNQGLFTKQSVGVSTTAGFGSFVIKTTAASLLAAGWPAEGVDIVKATAEQLAVLKTAGVKWTTALNGVESAAGVTTAFVDISDVTGKLLTTDRVTTDQSFTIEATDVHGQSTGAYVVAYSVKPPIFAIEVPAPGNIWATKADLTTTYTVENDLVPTVQYKIDGGGWVTPAADKLEVLSSAADKIVYRIKGLTNSTTYAFRAVMGNHTTDATVGTTEAPNQVPNSDMEEWNRWTVGSGLGTRINVYQPCVSGDADRWWDTNNARTTAYGVGGMSGVCNAYNSFPAVSYIYEGRSGKAAELRSISASGSGVNSSGDCIDSHRTPGRLLIGNYTHTGGNGESIDYGRPFTTRPTSFTFYYQYEPWGGDNRTGGDDEFIAYIEVYSEDIRIGRGEFRYRSNARQSITSWTQASADLIYSRTDLKATKVTMEFRSSVDNNPAVSSYWERKGSTYVSGKKNNDYANGCPKLADQQYSDGKFQFYGSVLRIDDINLVY